MKLHTGAGFALITLCALLVPQTECYLIIELFKVAKMTFSSVYHTWDLFEGKLQPNEDSPYYQEKTLPEEYVMKDHPKFYVEREEQKLLSRIDEINRKIAGIEERLRVHEEIIITKLEKLPHAIMTEMKVNQVLDIVRDVESRHETFTKYMKTGVVESKEGKKGLDRLTVLNFAQFTTSHSQDSPLRFLDRLHSILVPHFDSDKLLGTRSFFYTFKDHLINGKPSEDVSIDAAMEAVENFSIRNKTKRPMTYKGKGEAREREKGAEWGPRNGLVHFSRRVSAISYYFRDSNQRFSGLYPNNIDFAANIWCANPGVVAVSHSATRMRTPTFWFKCSQQED